jgi:hypothetical protein
VDPEWPIVVADTWLDQRIALCYLPVHCLVRQIRSQFVVVLSDFAALTAPPSSSWGTGTWATDRDGAPELLKDLGLREEFLDGLVTEIDAVLRDPAADALASQ